MERLIIRTDYGARFHITATKEEAQKYAKLKKDNPEMSDEQAWKASRSTGSSEKKTNGHSPSKSISGETNL